MRKVLAPSFYMRKWHLSEISSQLIRAFKTRASASSPDLDTYHRQDCLLRSARKEVMVAGDTRPGQILNLQINKYVNQYQNQEHLKCTLSMNHCII